MKRDIVNTIKSKLNETFRFEALNSIIGSSNLSSAQYLRIKTQIERFVLGIQDSFSADFNAVGGTELELNEIKKMLNYKDFRSVLNWCKKNGVFIFSQGNSQFVNKTQFQMAFQKPFIEHLKNTYSNWRELLTNYLNNNILNLLPANDEPKEVNSNYQPESTIEKSFLQNIKNL